jgi:hypothetical protein
LVCGGTCRAFALPSGRCWNHDPERAAERHAARVKGGTLKALKGRLPRLDTAGSVLRFNAELVHRLLVGELEVDVCRTVIYALSLQRQLIESGDLEKRLEVLEATLEPQPGRRAGWQR